MKWKTINSIPENTAIEATISKGTFEVNMMQPKKINTLPRPIYVNKNGQYFFITCGIEFSFAS